KLNQLIDKFNLEKDENKRQDLLEKMGAIPIAETRNPNPKRIGLKRDKNRK
ncbi:9953_t:CDS:1, partial [Racocetra persica]